MTTTMTPLDAPIRAAATDAVAVRADLRRRGVSVVRVVDDARAAVIEQRTSHVPALLRPDGGTANGARGIGGVVKGYGAASDPEVVEVRLMDEVRDLFAALYGVADVMSGWDGMGITGNDAGRAHPPTARALDHPDACKAYVALTNSTLPPHVDVSATGTRGALVESKMAEVHPLLPCCVQGQYVVTSVPRGGATLVVSPGAYADAPPDHVWFAVGERDFCPCTPAGHTALRGTWRAVEAPRGCVVLWLSRTPHGNKLADFGVDPCRFVIYVSWQARALVADAEERRFLKRKKMAAVTTGGTTDHWATHAPSKVTRGAHFSNGAKKTTRVVYNAERPPPLDAALRARLEEAF